MGCGIIGRAPSVGARRISAIVRPYKVFLVFLCILPIDILSRICYTITIKREETRTMEKKITMAMLNETIEVACDNLRRNCGFTDEQCLTFAADLMENLAKDGWKIVEG